ncbi:MAG: type II toxin-antitoxin system MqsA family antitoxin [Chloroflexi bacterium]|nr:type II toxin-antitoxin system MqsA family antitoxin [Chloroflexota bacterium]
MTGKHGSNDRCPLCGGRLSSGMATMPFLFTDTVVLIRNVPAKICRSCHEPYVVGKVTDRITDLLNQLRPFRAEVLIVSYEEPLRAPALSVGGKEAILDTAPRFLKVP